MRALGIGHSQGQLNIVGTFPQLQALHIVNHKAKFIMNLKIYVDSWGGVFLHLLLTSGRELMATCRCKNPKQVRVISFPPWEIAIRCLLFSRRAHHGYNLSPKHTRKFLQVLKHFVSVFQMLTLSINFWVVVQVWPILFCLCGGLYKYRLS
jgi:hypothetical protein